MGDENIMNIYFATLCATRSQQKLEDQLNTNAIYEIYKIKLREIWRQLRYSFMLSNDTSIKKVCLGTAF